VAAKFPVGSVYVASVLSFDLERHKVTERCQLGETAFYTSPFLCLF
jgi:hypothetical protein